MKAPGSTWELHLKLANSSLGEGINIKINMKLLTMAMFVLIVNVIGTFGDLQCIKRCGYQGWTCITNCFVTDYGQLRLCYKRCNDREGWCKVRCRIQ